MGEGQSGLNNDGESTQASKNPGGRRKVGEKKPFSSYDSNAKLRYDEKGQQIFDGYAPGDNFKKKSSADISGEVKQSSQEAAEAVEQQRIPKATREMLKGYFRNLSGQKEKENK